LRDIAARNRPVTGAPPTAALERTVRKGRVAVEGKEEEKEISARDIRSDGRREELRVRSFDSGIHGNRRRLPRTLHYHPIAREGHHQDSHEKHPAQPYVTTANHQLARRRKR